MLWHLKGAPCIPRCSGNCRATAHTASSRGSNARRAHRTQRREQHLLQHGPRRRRRRWRRLRGRLCGRRSHVTRAPGPARAQRPRRACACAAAACCSGWQAHQQALLARLAPLDVRRQVLDLLQGQVHPARCTGFWGHRVQLLMPALATLASRLFPQGTAPGLPYICRQVPELLQEPALGAAEAAAPDNCLGCGSAGAA